MKPLVPGNSISNIYNYIYFEKSWRYSQLKVDHQNQQHHRGQTENGVVDTGINCGDKGGKLATGVNDAERWQQWQQYQIAHTTPLFELLVFKNLSTVGMQSAT